MLFPNTHTNNFLFLFTTFFVVVNLLSSVRASLVTQLVKNLPGMHLTRVWSLGWEDPLEKRTASHFNILAWRIPWTIWSKVSQRVSHDWGTFTSLPFIIYNKVIYNSFWVISVPPIPFIIDVYATFQLQWSYF